MALDTSQVLVTIDDDIDELVRQYFTNYFSKPLNVDQNEYEQVKTFFQQRTVNPSNPSIASNTVAVLLAADELGIYPSDIIQRVGNADYQKTFSLILNLTRKGTSLIGYEQSRVPSKEILRQVTA
jgi:hypothetical protein